MSINNGRAKSKHNDFIVVGDGTAGNVVAGKLAEISDVKILAIEAGVGRVTYLPIP